MLQKYFIDIVQAIPLDDRMLALGRQALHESHQDQNQFHLEVIARLQAQYSRFQNRIGRVYKDMLDGVFDAALFRGNC